MKSKHKFVPSQVVPMEERALLSHFSPGIPVNTLGYKGAFVLTSTTYNKLQSQINTAILTFEHSVMRHFNRQADSPRLRFGRRNWHTRDRPPSLVVRPRHSARQP